MTPQSAGERVAGDDPALVSRSVNHDRYPNGRAVNAVNLAGGFMGARVGSIGNHDFVEDGRKPARTGPIVPLPRANSLDTG